MLFKNDKTTMQLAELVYNEGEILERNAFMLGNQHKVSYVMSYNGYRYYVTLTDGEITFFHQGCKIGGKDNDN